MTKTSFLGKIYLEGGIFLKKSSIIILIIAILVIIAGVAIYMITNQKSTNNSSINLKTMIDTIYKNSNVELPSLETKKIGLSDNNVVSSYTFLSNNDNVEELVVSEPVMSSQAYSLVAIKLKNNEDCIRKIQIDNYELIFGFYYLNKFEVQSNDLLNCTPYISFKFNKCVGISELKSCYLKLINFLAFINFNNNIPIEKIEISNIKDSENVYSGICFINSKSKNFDSKKSKAILANFFDDDELISLFKQTSNYNDIKSIIIFRKKQKTFIALTIMIY